jgi:hypothetical protein
MKRTTANRNLIVMARRLQYISRRTLPLYARIANNPVYTARLVRSIRAKDFDRTERIVKEVLPDASVSVGAGFGAIYTVGNTTLEVAIYRPGRIVRTSEIQAVSRIMLPFLGNLATSKTFALRTAVSVSRNNPASLLRLARTVVPAQDIRTAGIDSYGLYFVVRASKHANYNFIMDIL